MKTENLSRLNLFSSNRAGWRFAVLHFLTFASLAVFGIYGSLYFKRRGVSNVQLGVLYTIPSWIGAFAPLLWGIASDALQRRRILHVIIYSASAALCPLFWFWNGQSFILLCLLMAVFSVFFRVSVPLVDAWTLDHIAQGKGDYGRIRSWGSVGYIAPLIASVFVLRHSSTGDVRALLPVFYGVCGFCLIAAVYSLTLPDYCPAGRGKLEWSSLSVYLRPFALVFFLCAFIRSVVSAPYYTFFSIYLDEQGIPDNFKGVFSVVAVGAEIAVIAESGRLLRWIGAVPMLLAGIAAMTVRMFALSLEPTWPILLVVQTLHALSFGAYHVASIEIIRRITPEPFRATGQTFMGGLFGFGGIIGGVLGGLGAEVYGLPGLYRLLSFGGVVTFVLAAIGFAVWREGGRD